MYIELADKMSYNTMENCIIDILNNYNNGLSVIDRVAITKLLDFYFSNVL